MSFYCQIRCGEVGFSIDEWNKAHREIQAMPIPEAEKQKLIHPEPCKEQCDACVNVVLDKKAENKAKHGW